MSDSSNGNVLDETSSAEGCLWLGSWLVALVMVVLSLVGFFTGFISWIILVILLGAAVAIWFVGQWGTRKARERFTRKSKVLQEERNEQAQQALLQLKRGEETIHPLIVFLRPFRASAEYRLELGSTGGGFQGYSTYLRTGRFETSLAKFVAPFGEFIALGPELEERGAGRIDADDEEWQDIVQKICEGAKGIIMFPSATPGTSWEAVLLKERNYIAKTIFLMPPLVSAELSPRMYGFINRIASMSKWWRESEDSGIRVTADGTCQMINEHAPRDWEVVHSDYNKFGISLPEFDDYGLAFYLDDDGQIVKLCPLWAKISERMSYVDREAAREAQAMITQIAQSLGTDWYPIFAALENPANHYLLPLLFHLAHLAGWEPDVTGR